MSSPAERNKEPILNVLQSLISQDFVGEALEIASGCGIHVVHFAHHFENITWQPTDVDTRWLNYISEYATRCNLKNVRPALFLDISKPAADWSPEVTSHLYDLIMCINMIHITPFECTEGLFKTAGRLLKNDGLLVTYGPYALNGVLTPQSNVDFDKSLKRQNRSWGIRDISELEKLAANNNLTLRETFEMPANNKTLIFRKDNNFHN